MNTPRLECLFKSWGHSREEDRDGVSYYRPAGFRFPLSRGRNWLEFKPDGTVNFTGPSADDRATSSPGFWKSENGALVVRRGTIPVAERADIVACDDGVLMLRWK